MDSIIPSNTDDDQGNLNVGQSPPLLPNEYQINPNNNYQQTPRRKVRQKKVVSPIKKVSRCRIIFQVILSQILYAIIIASISLQIYYGFSVNLIDDALVFILATIMLLLAIKGESSASCKLGCYNLFLFFCGFPIRTVGHIMNTNEEGMLWMILAIIRTVVVMLITSFNCPQEDYVIRIWLMNGILFLFEYIL